MMKRLLDRHEWSVDLAAAVLCASALAHATSMALERRASPAPPAMRIAAPQAAGGESQGVRKLGAHTYEIKERDSLLGVDPMTSLRASARMVPEIRDGRVVGFRLYAVRADGPLPRLGFQNGDVIRAINGVDLTTPEQALEVYAAVRSAAHVSVALERNGEPITNEYWVRR
jgi:general secretion pathway protein C